MDRAHEVEVVIAGIGARTPLGLTAPSTAAAVRAGIAAMGQHPHMIDKAGKPFVVCRDPKLPSDLHGTDRCVQLALAPANEAVEQVRRCYDGGYSVLVALPEDRPGRPRAFEQEFSIKFRAALSREIDVTEVACYSLGHAGGLYCLEQALNRIRAGTADVCLIGGVESYLEPETLEWLDETEQLHSETTTWGFCPSEGAGFCVLARVDVAERFDDASSLTIVGVASGVEPNPIRTETVCIGEGLTTAFAGAFARVPALGVVNHTICDMNGEPYRGNEYGFAVLRHRHCFADDADFDAPADCWGDVGAASGPLFIGLFAAAAEKGYSRGPTTLVWTSSNEGLRTAAVLRSPLPA